MLKRSMIVLTGVLRNNLYYLKGNMVTRQVETSSYSDDDNSAVAQKARTYR